MLLPNSKHLSQYYKKLEKNKYIAKFTKTFGADELWHFTAHSVPMGLAIGIACAWIPLPFHTLIAVMIAIILNANIPLVVTSIWLANPLTMPVMYYYAYRVGEYILGIHPPQAIHFHLSINDVLYDLHEIWQPFLVGCFVLGLVSGAIAYLGMHLVWRIPRLQKRIRKVRR